MLCLSLVLGAVLSLLSYFLKPSQTVATQPNSPAARIGNVSAPSDISGEILDVRIEATEVTFIADPYRANLSDRCQLSRPAMRKREDYLL